MKYNKQYDSLIIVTDQGVIDYIDASTMAFPDSHKISFQMKMDTDLFDLAKSKTTAETLELSNDGEQFVTVSQDRLIRVFKFKTGKLRRVYNESL